MADVIAARNFGTKVSLGICHARNRAACSKSSCKIAIAQQGATDVGGKKSIIELTYCLVGMGVEKINR